MTDLRAAAERAADWLDIDVSRSAFHAKWGHSNDCESDECVAVLRAAARKATP